MGSEVSIAARFHPPPLSTTTISSSPHHHLPPPAMSDPEAQRLLDLISKATQIDDHFARERQDTGTAVVFATLHFPALILLSIATATLHPEVTGFELKIEDETMIVRRSSQGIAVGRAPSGLSPNHVWPHSTRFHCPVISRAHAEVSFERGEVIDDSTHLPY